MKNESAKWYTKKINLYSKIKNLYSNKYKVNQKRKTNGYEKKKITAYTVYLTLYKVYLTLLSVHSRNNVCRLDVCCCLLIKFKLARIDILGVLGGFQRSDQYITKIFDGKFSDWFI